MSADYKLEQQVNFKKLLKYATTIKEVIEPNVTTDQHKIITEGKNFLHLYLTKQGRIDYCSRYGSNNEDVIFNAIYDGVEGTPLEGYWNALYVG